MGGGDEKMVAIFFGYVGVYVNVCLLSFVVH
jgi:hypothetical protein